MHATRSLIIGTSLCLSTSVLAVENAGLNGQPFQTLSELIEANSVIISQNADAISNLEKMVSQLKSDIAGIQQKLDALSGRVSINEKDIAALLVQVNSNSASLNSLRLDLSNLKNATEKLAIELKAEIASVDASIRVLIDNNNTLIQNLQVLVEQLKQKVAENTSGLDPLSAQVSLLLVQVSSNTNSITSLQASRNEMQSQLGSLEQNIENLSNSLKNVISRVEALEGGNSNAFFDFESGPQGWTVGGFAFTSIGFPSRAPMWELASSLPGFIGKALPSTWWTNPNVGNDGAERSYVQSPVLTAFSDTISVNFDSFSSNEGGYPTVFDVEHVQVSINGGPFSDIHGPTPELHTGADATFRNITFDVAGVVSGDTVEIRFLYDTADSCCGPGDITGWAFDNVLVTGAK
ncbi:MAG: hypothetical protein OEZ68_18280 [Gammaproteobacteria bacterium]|nr:hypothetical protein [Gammaproteobacteria bacterium]MDH5802754.1 hypothetical protein [Gammaproteobacteria bacterium]